LQHLLIPNQSLSSLFQIKPSFCIINAKSKAINS
jgi:hypothetical protein